MRADEILRRLPIGIERAVPTAGRLTLTGKLSVDEHWPISFKVQLAPRSGAALPFTDFPRWTHPTKAAPIR